MCELVFVKKRVELLKRPVLGSSEPNGNAFLKYQIAALKRWIEDCVHKLVQIRFAESWIAEQQNVSGAAASAEAGTWPGCVSKKVQAHQPQITFHRSSYVRIEMRGWRHRKESGNGINEACGCSSFLWRLPLAWFVPESDSPFVPVSPPSDEAR
jgi:hypothetical protein